ncbi:hypothetical protein ACFQ3Z_03580 [Streptomyces nogalater]
MNAGPTAAVPFTFSDRTAGYVVGRRGREVELRTLDGRLVTVHLTDVTYAHRMRNLGEPYQDATGSMDEHLRPGAFLFSYGPVYPEGGELHYQATELIFVTEAGGTPPYERAGWWTSQLGGSRPSTAPRSSAPARSTSPTTGPRSGRAARRPGATSRRPTRSPAWSTAWPPPTCSPARRTSWTWPREFEVPARPHALQRPGRGRRLLVPRHRCAGPRESKLFASEFGDDYRAIPAYEQIYALVGLTQTYRLTGDPVIRADIEGTVRLFERYFADRKLGGYFSTSTR